MGIKNLNNLLRKKCPHVFVETHLSEYAFKKLAIDVSLFMCKFKAICGDRWLTSFVNLVQCHRRNEIHCVFIYDNGAPDEKSAEREDHYLNGNNITDEFGMKVTFCHPKLAIVIVDWLYKKNESEEKQQILDFINYFMDKV